MLYSAVRAGGGGAGQAATMTWQLQFFNARQRRIVSYTVDAPLPAAAVASGWASLRAQHPGRGRGPVGLLERAERASADDRNGWVLYRIVADQPPAAAAPPA